ncbi:MAG: hypothetical protein DRP66_03070 [Planctomycetota bacterium]|nr:MAG: hypothetical protein DRP66_03070 [Planctomycetota bacterium]
MASNDLGNLGSKESAPVTYTWRFIDNLSGLAVWVILLIVFILFRENWTPKAFLILLPMFVVNILWIGVKKATGMPSSAAGMFDVMFNSFTIGMATVWLVSHKFAGLNRFVIFLLSLIVMVLVYALGIFSFSGLEFTSEAIVVTIFFCIVTAATFLAFALTGWRCRRRYTALRFMLWLALWCPVLCLTAMLAYALTVFIIMIVIMGRSFPMEAIIQIPLVGLLIGGILYLLLLPYMILVLNSDLFRRRFYGCFRLKGMSAPAVAETEDFSGERATDLI